MNDKKPDDAEFERALSFFLGSCEAQEVDMWDRYDAIKSYAYGYKKLYWDLLGSWAELKVKHGVLLERAQPKYKQVDLDQFLLKSVNHYCDGNNRAISLIKAKYGELYAEVKE